MSIALRPARSGDFEFCARLYFSGMEETIRQLKLDMVTQNRNLRERWNVEEVRIITSDGTNVGWMQRPAAGHTRCGEDQPGASALQAIGISHHPGR